MATKKNNVVHFWQEKTFYLLSIASLFMAISGTMDNYAINHFTNAPDRLTGILSYLIVGSWIGTAIGLILALLFGRRLIDSEFKRVVFINHVMHKNAIISGSFAAGSTLFLLWGYRYVDPSVGLALTNMILIYTLLYDSNKKHLSIKKLSIPIALVLVGGIASAYSGLLHVTIMGLLLIVVASNGLAAVSEITDRDGARASDGVNLYIWRFLWLAITGSIIAFTVTAIRGYLPMLLKYMQLLISNPKSIQWIMGNMTFLFIGTGLKLVQKKHGVVSIVLLVMSAKMFLGYPIVIIGNILQPNAFEIPKDPLVWAVRIVGACILMAGIILVGNKNTEKFA